MWFVFQINTLSKRIPQFSLCTLYDDGMLEKNRMSTCNMRTITNYMYNVPIIIRYCYFNPS